MEIEKIKRKSRQSAVISGTGFLIIVGTFIFTTVKLNNFNKEITLKTADLTRLQDSLLNTQKQIDSKQTLINELVNEINKLRDPTIRPKAQSLKLANQKINGRQVYDFTLWIISSQHTINSIQKVSYEFDNPNMILKTRESSNASNGFLVSYRGWGCLRVVKISIIYKDDKTQIIYFNMCEFSESVNF